MIDEIAAAAVGDAEREMINAIAGPKAAGYGELLPQGMRRLASATRLGPDDVFIDIGSGTGKLAVQAVEVYGVAMSYGVELSPTRHALAQQAVERQSWIKPECASRVQLILGDASDNPQAAVALKSATVAFCNNVLFGEQTQERLAKLIQEAPPSLRVIVVCKPFDSGIVGYALDDAPLPCAMSWQVPICEGEPMPAGFPCAIYRRCAVQQQAAEQPRDGRVSGTAVFDWEEAQLNLLYDSRCAVCQWEVDNLQSLGSGGKILFTDVESSSFDPSLPQNGGVSYREAMARIKAVTADGEVLDGLDVFAACYEQVGLGWLFAFMRAPLVGPLVRAGYSLFALVRTDITRGKSLEALVAERAAGKGRPKY